MGKLQYTERLRLHGDNVPTVDIFIPSCGEPTDVLLDTLRATLAIDYPKDKFRVVVLDDRNSPQFESQVLRLGSVHNPSIFYTAHKVVTTTHFKGANLNHGLQFVNALPGGPSDLIAFLDVDMMPLPLWLRALVPSLLQDDKVALVNPPQQFYDISDGDPLGQSMDFIYNSIAPMQEALGTFWCAGSGWVAQRSAIDVIGGFPTDFVQEGIWTSAYLDAHGWKTKYVRRIVQYGLMGDTFEAHIRTSKRRAVAVSTLPKLLTHPKASNMSIMQRIGVFGAALNFTFTIVVTLFSMIAIPYMLSSGKPLIIYNTSRQLSTLLRFSFLQFLATWLYGFIDAAATQMHKPSWPPNAQMYLAPYQIMALFIAGSPNNTPTAAVKAVEREGKARISGTMAQRLWIVLWEQGAMILLAIIAICAMGVCKSLYAAIVATGASSPLFSYTNLAKESAVRAAWPPALVLWTAIAVSCWTPIGYAISPPPTRSRESLLVRDPVTKVACPIDAADPRRSSERLRVSQRFALFALGYFTLAFLASWI